MNFGLNFGLNTPKLIGKKSNPPSSQFRIPKEIVSGSLASLMVRPELRNGQIVGKEMIPQFCGPGSGFSLVLCYNFIHRAGTDALGFIRWFPANLKKTKWGRSSVG
jgi:hypothetical protein